MHFCFGRSQTCGCRGGAIHGAIPTGFDMGLCTMDVGLTSRLAAVALFMALLGAAFAVDRLAGTPDHVMTQTQTAMVSRAGPAE